MSKKTTNFSASDFGRENKAPEENTFYFGAQNYKWMLIGLAFILIGFLLMMGPDANTVECKLNHNVYKKNDFSNRRIKIATLYIEFGFAIVVYALLKKKK